MEHPMSVWVSWLDGALSALLAILLAMRYLTRRLALPPAAYVVCWGAGMCGWVAFQLSPGVRSASLVNGGIPATLWYQWQWIGPTVLPVLAAALGWVGVRSHWRWWLLASGILFPVILMSIRFAFFFPSRQP